MRRCAFVCEGGKQKIGNVRTMPRLNRFWLVVAGVAFCLGIAIGRLTISTGTSNPVARTGPIWNNQSATTQTNAASDRQNSKSTHNSRSEQSEIATSDGDVYARITD